MSGSEKETTRRVIVFDGPPASGKSTIAIFLKYTHRAGIYRYKRLGFVNITARLLMRIAPHLKNHKFTCGNHDPILLVNSI